MKENPNKTILMHNIKEIKILQLTTAISLVIGEPPVNFARTIAIILYYRTKSMTEYSES